MIYEFLTPANIWRDFEVDNLDLEVTEVRSFVEDGMLTSCYYFTAQVTQDGKIRAFVKVSRPTHGRRFPTVLFADAAVDQNPGHVLSFVKEGYAVATFDYAGRAEGKTYFTLYPDSLAYANYASAGRALVTAEPSARHTSWHVWTALARRVITFLTSLDYVDTEKIGMLGIKEGANVVWQTVGTDNRISACCTLFGWARPTSSEDEEEQECWEAGVAPQSYMPNVHVPVMVAGGSNDRATEFERTGRLSNLPKTTPLYHAVSVGLDRNMYESDVRAIHGFFAHTLCASPFPTAPQLCLTEKDGAYTAVITAPGALDAELLFAVGENQEFLSFTHATVQREGDVWTASLGALTGEKLFVVAKADFGAFCLTATPCSATLNKKGTALRGNHVVYTSSMGTDTAIPVGSAPVFDRPLSIKAGAGDIMGITSETGGLALWVADITPKNISMLSFDTSCQAERTMTVNLVFSKGGVPVVYSAKVDVVPGKRWQRHLIELRDFKSDTLSSPDGFAGVKRVEFVFGSAVVINNVLWI